MGSMNNWLGFSLSHPQQQTNDFNSGTVDCFDLSSDDSTLPPPFGILEAFNQNNHHNHSQDWTLKDTNSELTMLMGSSYTAPKLENFLGVGTGEYVQYANFSPETGRANKGNNNNNNNSSSIGLSMIKNWLRNNPAPENVENDSNENINIGGHVNENDEVGGVVTLNSSAQTLSLSMSTGGESSSSDNKRQQQQMEGTSVDAQTPALEVVPRKSIDTFGQRTSIYRGVTRHRWTGRYEAHLWDNSCRREGQTRKGRQVYLGGYDKEEKAARAYDLAALKYWGTTTTTNFPISNYEKEIEEMKHMTRQEYVASLRRKSSGFSRGASIYRGVTRHHQHGRWQARIGRVAGNKDLYLGTFSTQEEAAEAYDIAAIKFRGLNAVTNFEISRYDVKSILESSTLPIGVAAKRLKEAEQAQAAANDNAINHWPTIAYHEAQVQAELPFSMHYPPSYTSQQHQRVLWCKQEEHDNSFQQLHHQLQLGNTINTHNFFHQPSTSVLHNLMNLDSSSMEHSSIEDVNVGGYGGNNGGYFAPVGTTIINAQDQGNGYENPYVSTDAYNSTSSRNLAGSVYDQGSTCNNWNIPTAVPTLAHGAPTFTVWNDT